MFHNTGANAFAKNQMRLAYEDKRDLYCRYRLCVFLGKGRGGTPHMHGHKESNKDLNLKILTSEWDSNPRPHEY